MCKENSEILRSIKNTGNNLSMKQMFDMSEQFIVGQSDETYGVTTIGLRPDAALDVLGVCSSTGES